MKNYNGKEGLLKSRPGLKSLIYQQLILWKKRDLVFRSNPRFDRRLRDAQALHNRPQPAHVENSTIQYPASENPQESWPSRC
jgi:hypothetical protein